MSHTVYHLEITNRDMLSAVAKDLRLAGKDPGHRYRANLVATTTTAIVADIT